MKKITLLVVLFISIPLLAQDLEKCGLDNNGVLNTDEAAFLNNYFKKEKGDFDFTGKKILIVTGSGASDSYSKTNYFESVKSRLESNDRIASGLYPFTQEEKIQSGGYDGILTFYTKIPPNKQRIIKKIKAGKRNS